MSYAGMRSMGKSENISLKRCFGKRAAPRMQQGKNAHRLLIWTEQLGQSVIPFNDAQTESMANLLPLLLCGEQSAQLVFNQEIARLSANSINQVTGANSHQLVLSLMEVESDECRHDIALQSVAEQLPEIDSVRKVQRLAKRFYSSLSRVDDYSQHFVRIAILDTCVTQIMQAFEQSHLGINHPFSQLCGLIKKDEAKHVYISRHHAIELGASHADFHQQQAFITQNLFQLLTSQGSAFEHMGICLDSLQQKLEEKWQ
ncbi:hypothetical protein Q4601_15330 [Shewanella sp. 1_MG-2023]|uniref:hypothetical protein n=1 Tax=unclassified Shewanella TaxID=196818 RepID=UPI0026E1D003|nr:MULTISPECIES: hypothetical protein [unclassified Shewanella]MDO6611046.1 hypothetical protein [Shewanella sp. 7_MG-2023]MDO6771077.1 hypothetical protein [Shewanella sp. 2_MG-2023]MDO6795679.1 hypothetical protein [Shewanella sp. 1_MG-2023]